MSCDVLLIPSKPWEPSCKWHPTRFSQACRVRTLNRQELSVVWCGVPFSHNSSEENAVRWRHLMPLLLIVWNYHATSFFYVTLVDKCQRTSSILGNSLLETEKSLQQIGQIGWNRSTCDLKKSVPLYSYVLQKRNPYDSMCYCGLGDVY